VIVPAHQGASCIGACLDAVRALVPEAEVIVVDNASTDGTGRIVRAGFPGCRLVENERNAGFGSACNRGAALAHGAVLLFLNQDAVLQAPLARALERFAAEPELGVVGALVRYADGRLQHSQGRPFGPARLVAHWYLYPLRALRLLAGGALVETEPSAYQRARDVPWVSGCCLLVRRELFRELGGFDADYFMYVEDIDLCSRVRARGARVAYDPALKATHGERGGTRGAPEGISEFALVHTVAGHAVHLVRHSGRAPAALALAALIPCFLALWALGGLASRIVRSRRGVTNARAFGAGAAQAWRSLVDILGGGRGHARAGGLRP
jgi:GT2 family glycosyltransferase